MPFFCSFFHHFRILRSEIVLNSNERRGLVVFFFLFVERDGKWESCVGRLLTKCKRSGRRKTEKENELSAVNALTSLHTWIRRIWYAYSLNISPLQCIIFVIFYFHTFPHLGLSWLYYIVRVDGFPQTVQCSMFNVHVWWFLPTTGHCFMGKLKKKSKISNLIYENAIGYR